MDARLSSPASQRNRDPILAVLRRALPARGAVLEIASGAGEHALWFARHLTGLVFQPSDPDPEARASIAARVAHEGLANVRAPLELDAQTEWKLPQELAHDLVAILCINMIHISPWTATLGLLRNAAAALPAGGLLYLYGPYRRGGAHSAPSNAAFDADLRRRDPAWGVRDLEAVTEAAAGFTLEEVVEMPANNLSLLLRRATS